MEFDNNNKKRTALASYIRMTATITILFILALSAGLLAYSLTKPKKDKIPEAFSFEAPPENAPREPGGVISNILNAPERTAFLVAGIDENLLADVILAGCFNSVTKTFDFISVPRDTLAIVPESDVKALAEAGRRLPADGEMKINAVYSYAGRELGARYLMKQVEYILGVKFDYYAVADLAGFRAIVDAAGGVYMQIRPQGFYYSDPDQDLIIEVPGGMQLLDGKAAEGVVRYREDYARADIERIEMQHEFMKEFFKQVLNKQTIIKSAPELMATVINHVRSDFGLADAPRYLRFIGDLKAGDINFHTLPGGPDETNVYYVHDAEKTKELTDKIFRAGEAPEKTENETAADVKKLRIQILDGGDKPGTAKERAERLKLYGYNVINVGDYSGTKQIKTRILCRRDADYKTLAGYFNSPIIETGADIADVYDVVIITGLNE